MLDKRFFRFAINQKLGELIDIAHGGVGLRHVTKGKFEATEVALAPFNEQRRIADKLDVLLAQVDACRERLDRVSAIVKRFRQAVLAAATSGRLTEDWRIKEDVEFGWLDVKLVEVAEEFLYGTSSKSSKAGKVPVLRMGNIQAGKLVWDDLVYTSDLDEIAKYRLVPGDVLFNRTNSPELVGKAAIFQGERPAIFAGYLIRVRCNRALLMPEFLNIVLGSPTGREYCWSVKSDGVSQSNINASKLGLLPMLLPPPEEQQEIVRRVELLFSYADRLEQRIQATRARVERLTPALLAKAFRGELVPQDPNDESAEVLLERLRQTASDGETKRRPGRKSSSR